MRTCVLYLGELTFYHWFDNVIKLELWHCVVGSKLNLSNKPTTRGRCLPPPAAHAHLSNAAMWHELRLTRKHLRRHNNEGRELTENATDRTIFLKGQLRGEKKKKRWNDDHMKMFYHMQHISSASTERQLCMRAKNSCRQKTMPRIVCTKNKPHCPNGGNTTHSAYLTHK